MRRGKGFTLLELMAVIAIISLLLSVLIPAVYSAKQQAKLAVCQAGLKSLSAGLWLYTADHQSLFPPFAFSSAGESDLLLSGHWGGSRNPNDPDLFGRMPNELAHVNLDALAYKQYVAGKGLVCPGAAAALQNHEASYFPYTDQFSTYCLRFPHSEDLFRDAPALRGSGGADVLAVYRMFPSGHRYFIPCSSGLGRNYQTVPFISIERTYRTDHEVYNPARGALLADAFWMQDSAADSPTPDARPVLRQRCHEKKYNVLLGHGGVATVTDDSTIESNAVAPGESPRGQSPYYEQAETLWAFFDSHN
jgi:prepilin-type N-terminal cleavage/methylation domain-containing protein